MSYNRARLTRCSKIISMVPSTSSPQEQEPQSEMDCEEPLVIPAIVKPPARYCSLQNVEANIICDEQPLFTPAIAASSTSFYPPKESETNGDYVKQHLFTPTVATLSTSFCSLSESETNYNEQPLFTPTVAAPSSNVSPPRESERNMEYDKQPLFTPTVAAPSSNVSPPRESERNIDYEEHPLFTPTGAAPSSNVSPPRESERNIDYEVQPLFTPTVAAPSSNVSPPRESERNIDYEEHPLFTPTGAAPSSNVSPPRESERNIDYEVQPLFTPTVAAPSSNVSPRESERNMDYDKQPLFTPTVAAPSSNVSPPRESERNIDYEEQPLFTPTVAAPSSNVSPPRESERNMEYDKQPLFTPTVAAPSSNVSPPRESERNIDYEEQPLFTPTVAAPSSNVSPPRESERNIDYKEQPLFTPTVAAPSSNVSPPRESEKNIVFNSSACSDLDFDSDDSVLDKDYIPSSLEAADLSQDSNDSTNTIPNSVNVVVPESPEVSTPPNLTKKGELRKRQKHEETVLLRKLKKTKSDLEGKYKMKPGCNVDKCKKRCHSKFTEESRKNLHNLFRSMSWKEQKYFIINNTSSKAPSRITVEGNRKMQRNKTISYFFKNDIGTKINVCRIFFLETLGFTRKNDKSVRNAIETIENAAPKDRRGTKSNPIKIDDTHVIKHILSFNPSISHYRREHAPNRRYLPSDLSITSMYKNFCDQQNMNNDPASSLISYDFYRKVVKKLKISFSKLGHEECEDCEEYFIHNPEHKLLRHRNCQECQHYEKHRTNYTLARQAYKNDVEKQESSNNHDTVYYAVDLEKVIMLPRMENFKKVMFCPRVIVFNESFVPIGVKKNNPASRTYATIWHEATSGRKAIDITSCFRSFLISVRDIKNIVIWLDNCASQNKNWTLYSYLVYIVNSTDVNFETVTLKYLTAGHTHMAADEFHHQVELSMKKMKHLYDFEDFHQAVLSTRSNITVKVMKLDDFFQPEVPTSYFIRLPSSVTKNIHSTF